MRISTAALHNTAITGLLNRQAELSRTQSQIASGKRIETPADDPIGAVHILELKRMQAETDQFGRNADAVKTRLNHEEQALADAGLVLQRVREQALAANNSTLDRTALQAIASELRERVQELMDIANSRDGEGEYLFSGYATSTQPFARTGTVATYAGDQGERRLQTGPSQYTTDSHSGFEVFMNVPEGNGVFVTSATSTNTGSGSMTTGNVVNQTAWVRDTYTITFTAPDTYQVTNSAAAVIVPAVAGNYTSGSSIAFNGIQVAVSGAPALGDTFTVAASQTEDMFSTIDDIINTLQAGAGSPASRAQFATRLGAAIEQLDQHEQHLLNVRAEVGSRLSSLDAAESSRASFKLELETTLSSLQDVDYAEAISRMNRQLLGLEAAQSSYAQISRLSLFSYL
jgi:flagellar hook-associated protein 3 FlgL